MPKDLGLTARTYVKNLGKHVQRFVLRKESVRDALNGVSKDTKKVAHAFGKATETEHHKDAVQLVERGRRTYNNHDYERAEEVFRQAVMADHGYALAHTYLGHALYQQGRVKEAVASWRQAIAADPGSSAAIKAQKKIHHVERSAEKVVDSLAARLRKRR